MERGEIKVSPCCFFHGPTWDHLNRYDWFQKIVHVDKMGIIWLLVSTRYTTFLGLYHFLNTDTANLVSYKRELTRCKRRTQ